MKKIILILFVAAVLSTFAFADCLDLGDGSDGSLIVSNPDTIINNYTYVLNTTLNSGDIIINVSDTSEFSAGDEILIIQMQNYSGGSAGAYEYKLIESINGNLITLTLGLNNSYSSGEFNQTDATAAQIVRVPQYTSITINSGASIKASAWDGYIGGIVVFRATGTVDIAGSINVSAGGFRGGISQATNYADGYWGESINGTYAVDSDQAGNIGAGKGGRDSLGAIAWGGGGTGGGYGTAGASVPDSGSACPAAASYSGGLSYGSSTLSKIYLGSGGGSGGRQDDGAGSGVGGSGAGIVIISASEIIVSGTILANGEIGGTATSTAMGCGGGGSGGSVHLIATTLTLGDGLVNATGGPGRDPCGSARCDSSGGGDGRIRLDYASLTGTTDPVHGYQEICQAGVELNVYNPQPVNNSVLPSGTTSITLAVETSINAACRHWTTSGQDFSSMTLFTNTGELNHNSTITGLLDGQIYDYYIKCQNADNASEITDDYHIHLFILDYALEQCFTDQLGYWTFDHFSGNILYDILGSNYGTIYGNVTTDPSMVGDGFNFNGVDSYIDIAGDIDLANSTISFWITPDQDYGLGSGQTANVTIFKDEDDEILIDTEGRIVRRKNGIDKKWSPPMSWPEGEDGSIEIPPDDDPRQPTIGSGSGNCFVTGDMVISASESIDPDSSVDMSIENGCPPFNWTLSGTGFSIDNEIEGVGTNRLYANDSACVATITVTDSLGQNVTGYVRSTVGDWSYIGGDCVLPGVAATITQNPPNYLIINAEAIQGKFKQSESYGQTGFVDSCGDCQTIDCLDLGNFCAWLGFIIPCGSSVGCQYPEPGQLVISYSLGARTAYEWICPG